MFFGGGIMNIRNLVASLALFGLSNAYAEVPTQKELTKAFKGYSACMILIDANTSKVMFKYNPKNRCATRISPDSTFKIPLSLMAFDLGLITESTVFIWDKQDKGMPEWNQNQTPLTWERFSVVWVSQQLTPRIGAEKIEEYLDAFNYGNQDFSGDTDKNNGLTHAWLSSSLKISANEQLKFLQAMARQKLAVSQYAVDRTKANLLLGNIGNSYTLYGKTGSGWKQQDEHITKYREGWFVGYVEDKKHQYIFVTNISDTNLPESSDQRYAGSIAKQITLPILNKYFAN